MKKLEDQLGRFALQQPRLGKDVFIAPGAVVIGAVTLGDYSSVWCNTVLRADLNLIDVGHHTNIQDNSVLHLADKFTCHIGNYVTIGHGAIVHACEVRDEVLVGMGSTLLDGAIIGKQSIIGARALVTRGTKIPPGSLVLGMPAKVVRKLTREERLEIKRIAEKYVGIAAHYLKHNRSSPALL